MATALGGLLAVPFAAGAARKPAITIALKSLRNQFFTMMIAGADQHRLTHHGEYQLTIEGVQDETDVKGQEAIVQRCLDRHDDVLIIAPTDSSAMIPILLKTIASHTLVINVDNKLDERALVRANVNIPFVGPSNFTGARSVGDYVLHGLKPGSKVAIVEGLPQSINAKARSDGFREAIRSAGMALAGMRWGYWVSDKGRLAALELLDAVPDLAVLLCGNDNMAIGAVAAVAERHRRGKVLIGGYDNITDVAPYIADGRIVATADQHPALQIQYAIDLALQALRNHTGQGNIQTIVQTPVELVKRH
ncbi:substrate-binding domain-containing protein [Chromobacterium sphagni]|uniref:substrate-binding domain-containing protein n=1 Tax=Chromobacterium sphagni TaxID=1903179 RepID=UPI001959F342|nr:substrate-binding domain-containing protein [Chromobacterium sphagni]